MPGILAKLSEDHRQVPEDLVSLITQAVRNHALTMLLRVQKARMGRQIEEVASGLFGVCHLNLRQDSCYGELI